MLDADTKEHVLSDEEIRRIILSNRSRLPPSGTLWNRPAGVEYDPEAPRPLGQPHPTETVGGIGYLSNLADQTPSAAKAKAARSVGGLGKDAYDWMRSNQASAMKSAGSSDDEPRLPGGAVPDDYGPIVGDGDIDTASAGGP